MEGMFGLLAAALASSVFYLVYAVRGQERAKWWRRAAEAAGLTNVRMPEFLGVGTSLNGTAGPLTVKIQSYHRGKYEHGARIVVGGLRHGSYALSIRPEGVTTAIEKRFGEREIEVGDPAFDAAAYMQGSPGLIRAIFDPETRRLMRAMLGGALHAEGPDGGRTIDNIRVSVSDDELRVDIRSSPFASTERYLPSILAQVVDLGNRLRRPDDPAVRIAANIGREPEEEVRLADLRTLSSEFGGHPAAREALLAARADESPAVRLHAAAALGPDGVETLLELASPRFPDGVAARAIGALGPACPLELAAARLGEAREAGRMETALACVERLGASGGAAAVRELIGTLAEASDTVAAAAARALGTIADAAAESALLAALERDSAELRAAAAAALGRLGSPQAVAPLRAAASSHRLDGDLRRAARQAIAEIQSRVTGASPGQLTLAEDQAGQLSLAEEDRRGRVSMAQAARAGQAAGPERRG
jgi:HEAT repeat protein